MTRLYGDDGITPNNLTPGGEAVQLWRHGTRLVDFTAKNILQAARSDVESWAYNKDLKQYRKQLRAQKKFQELSACDKYLGYAFHVRHVNAAKGDVIALLNLALAERRGIHVTMSTKLSVIQMYENESRLEEALALARAASA